MIRETDAQKAERYKKQRDDLSAVINGFTDTLRKHYGPLGDTTLSTALNSYIIETVTALNTANTDLLALRFCNRELGDELTETRRSLAEMGHVAHRWKGLSKTRFDKINKLRDALVIINNSNSLKFIRRVTRKHLGKRKTL